MVIFLIKFSAILPRLPRPPLPPSHPPPHLSPQGRVFRNTSFLFQVVDIAVEAYLMWIPPHFL